MGISGFIGDYADHPVALKNLRIGDVITAPKGWFAVKENISDSVFSLKDETAQLANRQYGTQQEILTSVKGQLSLDFQSVVDLSNKLLLIYEDPIRVDNKVTSYLGFVNLFNGYTAITSVLDENGSFSPNAPLITLEERRNNFESSDYMFLNPVLRRAIREDGIPLTFTRKISFEPN